MFILENNTTQNTRGYASQDHFERVNSDKAPRHAPGTRTDAPEESSKSDAGMPARTTVEKLDKNLTSLPDVAVRYSIHKETGKTMIRIVDKENDRVIREIPSEEELERSVRLRMYVGKILDAIV